MRKNLSEFENLHLVLSYRPLGLVRATGKSLDEGGLAVDTGCILLPNGARVEVTLSCHTNGRHRVCRFPAEVVRAEPGETRLAFEASERSTIHQLLSDRLSEKTEPSQAAGWRDPVAAAV